MITSQISLFAFYAARTILFLLFGLSILTLAFFIERMVFFTLHFLKSSDDLLEKIDGADTLEQVTEMLRSEKSAETEVILKGLKNLPDPAAMAKRVSAWLSPEKTRWERFSAFLGSVGSNAPFIGLLGTVLGILKSFADLGLSVGKGGPQVVMSGISEALVVTAVGLGVAIPAVIFFNICKIRVKRGVDRVYAMVDLIESKGFIKPVD